MSMNMKWDIGFIRELEVAIKEPLESLKEFAERVLVTEHLGDWEVIVWGTESQGETMGECFFEGRMIFTAILNDRDNTRCLFIHEVSHAIDLMTRAFDARARHDGRFVEIQERLIRTYFPHSKHEEMIDYAMNLALYDNKKERSQSKK
jgi:hypothetical protein